MQYLVRILIIFCLTQILTGCSDPKDLIFSTDPNTWAENEELQSAIRNMSEKDRALFNKFLQQKQEAWSKYNDYYKSLKSLKGRHFSSHFKPDKPTIQYITISEALDEADPTRVLLRK